MSKETTLIELANNSLLRTKAYLFAVIIDCTEPFKTKDKEQFASKVKVIDASFNFLEESYNPEIKFNRFATIYIYSDNEKNIPKPKKVGDIIRLRRFNFVVSENGDLIGHQQKYSNWLIYDAEDLDNVIISSQNISKNQNRILTNQEKDLINSLRIWTHNFFKNHSMVQIAWWNQLKEPIITQMTIKNKEKASEVDLILKTEKVDQELKKISFRDYKNKLYHLILHASAVLNQGDVIKLKCVDVFFTKDGRYVRLTPCTSCLSLLPSSFDSLVFNETDPEKIMNDLEITTPFRRFEDEENFYNTRKKVVDKFPFLINYNFENLLINEKYLSLDEKNTEIVSKKLTLINKIYENRVPVELSFLRNMIMDPENNELSQFMHQRFVINAKIKDIKNKNPAQFILKHCNQCGFNCALNTKNFECCDKLMEIYFHLVFIVVDNEKSEEIDLPIYAVVGKDDHLFDLWELIPSPDNYKGFLDWDNISLFNKKIDSLLKKKSYSDFLVEIKATQNGKPFLKLVETLLMP